MAYSIVILHSYHVTYLINVEANRVQICVRAVLVQSNPDVNS